MNLKWKLRSIILFNHLAAVLGWVYVQDPRYWFLVVIGVVFIGKLGGEAGFHRYFAHKSFELNFFWKCLVLGLGCLNGIGSPISWAISHRAHHINSDTENDPHGGMPPYRVWLTLWRPARLKKTHLADFLQDRTAMWFHRKYFVFLISVYLLLGLIHWSVPVFLVSWPAVITFHTAGLVNTVCHRWGYRNHDIQDQSTNNLVVNFVTFGSGLHNNHHYSPSRWNNSEAWYELDIVAWMIRGIMKEPLKAKKTSTTTDWNSSDLKPLT